MSLVDYLSYNQSREPRGIEHHSRLLDDVVKTYLSKYAYSVAPFREVSIVSPVGYRFGQTDLVMLFEDDMILIEGKAAPRNNGNKKDARNQLMKAFNFYRRKFGVEAKCLGAFRPHGQEFIEWYCPSALPSPDSFPIMSNIDISYSNIDLSVLRPNNALEPVAVDLLRPYLQSRAAPYSVNNEKLRILFNARQHLGEVTEDEFDFFQTLRFGKDKVIDFALVNDEVYLVKVTHSFNERNLLNKECVLLRSAQHIKEHLGIDPICRILQLTESGPRVLKPGSRSSSVYSVGLPDKHRMKIPSLF